MALSPSAVLARREIVSRQTDTAWFFMSVETGQYMMLQDTAQAIWTLVDGERSISEIVDILLEDYEVDRDTCLKDSLGFAQELYDYGMVSVVG